MDGVFNEFFTYELHSDFIRGMEKLEDLLSVDRSKMVFVDGEEGDYGTISYSINGTTVAVREVLGGDCDDLRFTPEGVDIIRTQLFSLFAKLCREVPHG